MKTLSLLETKQWCLEQGIQLDQQGNLCPSYSKDQSLRFRIPTEASRYLWLSRLMETTLQPRDRCLLWVTTWGVWESGENWHLYYRLKQSYCDFLLLEEAPGHLFLNYESPDLVTFMQLGLISGWDMHLLPTNFDGRIFISHDGWFEYFVNEAVGLTSLTQTLVDAGL